MVLIGLCVIFFIFLAFKNQVSKIFQFVIRGFVGTLFLTLINTVFSQVIVGVNIVSLLTMGFLGLPGFVLLFITKMIA